MSHVGPIAEAISCSGWGAKPMRCGPMSALSTSMRPGASWLERRRWRTSSWPSTRRRAMSSSASVGLEVNVPSLWGDLSELRFEPVDFIADRVRDLAAELDQEALERLRSI